MWCVRSFRLKIETFEDMRIESGIFSHTETHKNLMENRFVFVRAKIHSFIHSGHFYSAPSSPLLLRGAPDYSTDTVSEFHAAILCEIFFGIHDQRNHYKRVAANLYRNET